MKTKYKILETSHNKKRFFLVFKGMDIVYKTDKKENADNFIQTALRAEKGD